VDKVQPLNTIIFILVAVAVTVLHTILIILGSKNLTPRHASTAPRLQTPAQTPLRLRSPVSQPLAEQGEYLKQVQKIDEILRSIEERLKTPKPADKKQDTENSQPTSPQELDVDLSGLKGLLELAEELREEVARLAGKHAS
jgi:hypothetical protein